MSKSEAVTRDSPRNTGRLYHVRPCIVRASLGLITRPPLPSSSPSPHLRWPKRQRRASERQLQGLMPYFPTILTRPAKYLAQMARHSIFWVPEYARFSRLLLAWRCVFPPFRLLLKPIH